MSNPLTYSVAKSASPVTYHVFVVAASAFRSVHIRGTCASWLSRAPASSGLQTFAHPLGAMSTKPARIIQIKLCCVIEGDDKRTTHSKEGRHSRWIILFRQIDFDELELEPNTSLTKRKVLRCWFAFIEFNASLINSPIYVETLSRRPTLGWGECAKRMHYNSPAWFEAIASSIYAGVDYY